MDPFPTMKSYLRSIYHVEEAILDEYIGKWEEYAAAKKTVLTAAGQIQRHTLFVLEGIQKSYYLKDGKQHVIAFTYPPSFTGIPESFFTQTPSKYFLETITDSRFLQLPYQEHQEMTEQYQPLETLFRKATEQVLAGLVERHHELMADDIETRFKNFMQRSPHLINMVPRKDLASYLRINVSNFSTLLSTVKV